MQPEFKVFGDEDLLKDTKLNIEIIRHEKYPYQEIKLETLFYNNTTYKIKEEDVLIYRIYASYKDSLIEVLEFENVMQRAKDYINHVYIKKNNEGGIYLLYVGRNSEIDKERGFKSKPLVNIIDFFRKKNITNSIEQEKYKEKFFNFHNTDSQYYKRISPEEGIKSEPKSSVYKTIDGKNYTEAEWEAYEKEQWNLFAKKNNLKPDNNDNNFLAE